MTAPTVALDLGLAAARAAIVADGRTALLRDPYTGADAWPARMLLGDGDWLAGTAAERARRAVPRRFVRAPRRALDARVPLRLDGLEITGTEALTAYVRIVAERAQQVYGAPLPRLVLAVPAAYPVPDPRRAELLRIGSAAGFADVELLDAPVAVALDPHTGAGLPDESYVLVCDLGVSWTVACVHRRGDRSAVLARHSVPAGADLDAALLAALTADGRSWLAPLVGAPGDAGLRARHEVVEFVERLKLRLSDTDAATDRLTPVTPSVTLTRQRLAELTGPAVAALGAACTAVLREAGTDLADLAAVVLAGGSARLPGVADALAASLGQPLRRAAEPEYAVVRGTARWAERADRRRVAAAVPRWRTHPLVWTVPDGARLLRWRVPAGRPYPARAELADVRTADDLVLTLTAPRAGTLLGPLPEARTPLGRVLAVPARRPATEPGPAPPRLHRFTGDGSYLLSADRYVLLECSADGSRVRSWAVASGELLGTLTPEPTGAVHGRLFVAPDGRPALVAWGPEAGIGVWDVQSGKLTARIGDATGGTRLLVDEGAWQAAVEVPGRWSLGGHRRTGATVWDLDTGALVERVGDGGWARRLPGFHPDSTADGFAAEAVGDGGALRARTAGGTLMVFDTDSGHELHRAPVPPGTRVAFEGDGELLLVHGRDDDGSRVDVLQV